MENANLTIDLNALYKNAKYINDNTNGGLIATVKNNAYNFGLKESVETFYKAGVRNFATTSIRDAIFIRNLYKDVMILSLNPCIEFETLKEHKISCVLPTLSFLKNNLENMKDISWHLEWAGLMRRSGCTSQNELIEIIKLAKENNIKLDGIWMHFSYADEFDQNNTYEKEKELWFDILEQAIKIHKFNYIHAQNSASYARDSKFKNHTHVRIGISLYGCPPYSKCDLSNNHYGLTLSAKVVAINHLKKNESIGYSSSFIANEDTKVAIINLGYGDGLIRKRVNGFDVEINSTRYPLVSMMMSHTVAIVDDKVNVGDTVYFYSKSIPVYEFTQKGVGTNSEQISPLNYDSLDVKYIPCNY
ncbi:alanine racemase [Peptostreptococcus equinus]|uniref:Alanine racemase n=1 Tax=Peptostreptococcus equinus TaxID=3003601 RepID=A0ABY7JNM9_9FIRM|nr:alanine racemase [Peptostreptococcus sp. CBA3647]WAW14705.1 alanine racemase [Peptostreptococcus sp. CBA3647]